MNKLHRANVNINLAFSSRLYCLDYTNPKQLSHTRPILAFVAKLQKNALSLLDFVLRLIMVVLKPILFRLLKLLTMDQKTEAIEYLVEARLQEMQRIQEPTSRRKKTLLRLGLRSSRRWLRPIASRAVRLLKPVITLLALKVFKLLRSEDKLKAIEKLTRVKLLEIKQVRKSTMIKMQQMFEAIQQDAQRMEKSNLPNEKPVIAAKPQALNKRRTKNRLLLIRNTSKISKLSRLAEPNEGFANLDSIVVQKLSIHLKEKVES